MNIVNDGWLLQGTRSAANRHERRYQKSVSNNTVKMMLKKMSSSFNRESCSKVFFKFKYLLEIFSPWSNFLIINWAKFLCKICHCKLWLIVCFLREFYIENKLECWCYFILRGERLNEYLFTSVETTGIDPRTVFLGSS